MSNMRPSCSAFAMDLPSSLNLSSTLPPAGACHVLQAARQFVQPDFQKITWYTHHGQRAGCGTSYAGEPALCVLVCSSACEGRAHWW